MFFLTNLGTIQLPSCSSISLFFSAASGAVCDELLKAAFFSLLFSFVKFSFVQALAVLSAQYFHF